MKLCTILTILLVLTLLLSLLGLVGCEPSEDIEVPETIMEIWAYLVEFFAGFPLMAIILLVFLDLGLKVCAAWRTKTFDRDKLADFYQTNVIPYIGGYTILYVAVQVASTQLKEGVLGPYTPIVGTGMLGVAWTVLLIKLGSSIVRNAKELGYGDIVLT